MRIRKFIRKLKSNLHLFKGKFHYSIYDMEAMRNLFYPEYKEIYSIKANNNYYSLEYFDKVKKIITVIMFESDYVSDIVEMRKLLYNYQTDSFIKDGLNE